MLQCVGLGFRVARTTDFVETPSEARKYLSTFLNPAASWHHDFLAVPGILPVNCTAPTNWILPLSVLSLNYTTYKGNLGKRIHTLPLSTSLSATIGPHDLEGFSEQKDRSAGISKENKLHPSVAAAG